MSDFILSICIPTFNRGNLLQTTLESIVCQDIFKYTPDIEIVISDNNSDDNTPLIAAHFSNLFPEKILYHRNEYNIGADKNFEMALSKGSGLFLKLHNDDLLFRHGSLQETIKLIVATKKEKPIIFFTNGNRDSGKQIEVCKDLNEFISCVSFFSTWIGGFGIWRTDFHEIEDFSKNAESRLIQADILFGLMASGRRAIVVTEHFFNRTSRNLNRGYNIAEVFGHNYLKLLKPYLALGVLSENIFQTEKREVLVKQVLPLYFDKKNDFAKTGFFVHMKDYWEEAYFQEIMEGMIFNAMPN